MLHSARDGDHRKGETQLTRRPPQSTKLRRRGCLCLQQELQQPSLRLSLQVFSLPVSWRLFFSRRASSLPLFSLPVSWRLLFSRRASSLPLFSLPVSWRLLFS